jgi:hypothetical protein
LEVATEIAVRWLPAEGLPRKLRERMEELLRHDNDNEMEGDDAAT